MSQKEQTVTYSGLKVVVTGADGFIGSHVTEMLVRQGAEVTALSCYSSFDTQGWLDDLPLDVLAALQIVRGDVRDAAFIRRLVQGQDIVFHLAALIAIPYSYIAPDSYVETNVRGTLNVLEGVRRAGVGRHRVAIDSRFATRWSDGHNRLANVGGVQHE